MLSYHIVFVFVQELIRLVYYISSIMLNCKCSTRKLRFGESFMALELFIQLLRKRLMCRLWEHTGFIKQCNNSTWFLLNQVKYILVVNKLNVTPINLLPSVLLLLHFEDILVKMLLEFFIGKIDA
uniref:Myo1 n=1 Tax=Arundo donax TaxID=35708 RepID=A0A0A9DWB5_ARUDO